MTTPSTVGLRCLAGVAGAIFLSGTAVLIFGDVLRGAALTEKHYIAAVIIAGTMLVGHLSYEAWRNTRFLSSLSFGFLFAVGTALVVLSSAGRQGESLALTQAQADATQAARAEAMLGLNRARAMLAEAQTALANECKTGSGKRCAGIQRTIDVYEAATRGEEAKLAQLGPVAIVAPDEDKFADVISTISTTSKERVKAIAVLVKPFLISLFLEFGAIMSFGFAFRGEAKMLEARRTFSDPAIDWSDLPSPSMFSGNRPEPTPPRGSRKRKPLPANVVTFPTKHPVLSALETVGGSVASNRELARLMKVSDGEASKRWQEVQHRLSVSRQGKQLTIALR